jgi:hypothetical protein
MLVPLIVFVAVVEVLHADKIPDPGAQISRQEPQLLKLDFASLLVVDPTVITLDEDAGEILQASLLSLPAATTTTMPASTAAATALF